MPLDGASAKKAAFYRLLGVRLGGCAFAIVLGCLAAGLLLGLAGARTVQAATTDSQVNPGESIQAAIDAASPGATLLIHAGTYTESLTLSKAVSLTGVSSATVIIHAIAFQRVLTVTGASVDSSVVISGLSLTGGDANGFLMGGGGLAAVGSTPRLENLRIYSNSSTFVGGGIWGYFPLVLTNVVVESNTTWILGGGVMTFGELRATGGRIAGNTCTLADCVGGGLYAATANLTGTQIVSNTSLNQGGGVYATAGATLVSVLVQGNTCLQAGCFGAGVFTSATLTATNTSFISNTSQDRGGGALVSGDARLTGGLWQGNQCVTDGCSGGGLLVQQSATLSGTHWIGNHARGGSGGLYAYDTVRVTNGLFQANSCSQAGCYTGALGAFELQLTNTSFISNSAAAGAGAASAEFISIIGGLVAGNRCTDSGCGGGGLSGYGVSANGTTFISNTAMERGGAISAAHLSVTAGLFERNACLDDGCIGGGVAGNVSLYLLNTQFISNSARAGGGGAVSPEYATVTGGIFQKNTCTQAACTGGGLNALGTLAMNGTHFLSNTSQGAGGGLVVNGTANLSGLTFDDNACLVNGCLGGGAYVGAALVLSQSTFLGNRAGGNGGGLAHISGNGSVINTLFARNSAATAGAALYLASAGAVDVLHSTIATPTLASGSAIEIVTGTVQIIDTFVASYSVGIRRLVNGSVYEDYNLFQAVAAPKLGPMLTGGNDLIGDAHFANPPGDDYHLRSDSAALDTGADVAITQDFDGDARPLGSGFDRGYDEYSKHEVFLPLVVR